MRRSAIASHMRLSSMRPPSTACSASTECGGTRMSSTAALSRARRAPASETMDSASDIGVQRWALLFPDNDDRHVDGHVGVQMNLHDVLTGNADRTVRQAHLRTLDLMTGLLHAVGDIGRTDRAEELALAAGLRRERELEAFELLRARLSAFELGACGLFELGAASFEFRNVFFRGERRLAFRQEEVAAVTGLHLHSIADVAEVGNLLQQNDFHEGYLKSVRVSRDRSVLIGVRQQREITRALHGDRELTLIVRLRAGDAARNDLAGFGDVALQHAEIFIVDLLDAFGGETAELTASEKTGHDGVLEIVSARRD